MFPNENGSGVRTVLVQAYRPEVSSGMHSVRIFNGNDRQTMATMRSLRNELEGY